MIGRSPLFSSKVLMLCAGLAFGLTTVRAQSTGTLQGRVMDPNGAAVAGVEVTVISSGIGIRRESATDDSGRYQIASLPVGDYRVDARARGFQTQIVETVRLEVGRTMTQDFQLRIGDVAEEVVVRSNTTIIELATVSVGHMIDRRTVQDSRFWTSDQHSVSYRRFGFVSPIAICFKIYVLSAKAPEMDQTVANLNSPWK